MELLHGLTFHCALCVGQNPWSDIGCRETLRISGEFFARALQDDGDVEAREAMHWAATLAGTALNNAGTALPHGCSYPVSGGVKARPETAYVPASGYSNRSGGHDASLLPHGYAVAVMAPAAFATTAAGTPARHLEAARLLGAHAPAGSEDDTALCGGLLGDEIIKLMGERWHRKVAAAARPRNLQLLLAHRCGGEHHGSRVLVKKKSASTRGCCGIDAWHRRVVAVVLGAESTRMAQGARVLAWLRVWLCMPSHVRPFASAGRG